MTGSSAAIHPALRGLELAWLGGLRPRAWVCVGSGYSREDVKGLLLERGTGFTGDAVTSPQQLALRIASCAEPGLGPERVLGPLARQEVLRANVADPRIRRHFKELGALKRQAGFFRKLDEAIQAGRLAFAHAEEGAAYFERLAARFGPNALRAELEALSVFNEAWLRQEGWWDPPLLLSRATAVLAEGWPQGLAKPDTIYWLMAEQLESRERALLEALGRQVRVVPLGTLEGAAAGAGPASAPPRGCAPWRWEQWHTLDDAADGLADELEAREGPSGYAECVVLIPDGAGVRRSLKRALAERGIPLADPRDPTRLRWDEALKWAMLPLRLVAQSYERPGAVSYLRRRRPRESVEWVQEIHARGIRRGLESYAGGKLGPAHAELRALEEALGGKRTCDELGRAHGAWLRAQAGAPDASGAPPPWILPFFERLWGEFVTDVQRVGLGARRARPLFWLERLQARLAESPPPLERFKPERGVTVYRLHQAALRRFARVYVLGLPASWLAGEGVGDYWFSEREREVLGAEFAVRSGIGLRRERVEALRAWLGGAESACWFDAAYDSDGRERESVGATLRELGRELGHEAVEEPASRGAHARWLPGYGARRPLPPLELALGPVPGGAQPVELTATALDLYSRCGLVGLAYQRWRLRDIRDPDTELWPEARGNILHAAAKHLLESRGADGAFAVSPRDALERAWREEAPRGLLRSRRAEQYVRGRMLDVLGVFCEKEREYFARAPSRVVSLDARSFSLRLGPVAITGTPDRIDEHPDGLFVIDYKTSSSLPNGTDMLELGYRLQLPFYALAVQAELGKGVAGVQFVELNRKGGRGSGVFFKRYNGKQPGKLTTLTARSRSLLQQEPEEVWPRFREAVEAHAVAYAAGRFAARPKKDKECQSCAVADLCGLRRLTERPGTEGQGGE